MFILELPSGRVLWQHDSEDPDLLVVGQPVFASDGKTLAVPVRARLSSVQYQIQLVDSVSGRVQGSLATSLPIGEGGWALAYTPNGRMLAAHCGCGVRLWDVATRKETTPIGDAHESYASSMVVSPQGFVVTADDDGSVRAWDAATTKQRWKFLAEHWVRAIAVSADGSLVAASSLDDLVHVLDGRTGRVIYRLAGHGRQGGYRTLGFFPNGRSLASFGDDYYLRVWDMKTGKARLEHAIRPKGMKFPDEDDATNDGKKDLAPATLTADARALVLGLGRFHFFDTGTGKEVGLFASEDRAGERISGFGYFAMSPNGKYLLASESGDYRAGKHSLSLIDVRSGMEVLRLLLDGSSAGRVAFAADGRAFATMVDGPRSEIVVYETASGNVRATIRGFRGQARTLAFFPDGRRLASAQSDSSVLIWDLSVPEVARKGP